MDHHDQKPYFSTMKNLKSSRISYQFGLRQWHRKVYGRPRNQYICFHKVHPLPGGLLDILKAKKFFDLEKLTQFYVYCYVTSLPYLDQNHICLAMQLTSRITCILITVADNNSFMKEIINFTKLITTFFL